MNETIKALTHCSVDDGCQGCPLKNNSSCFCVTELAKQALDLIDRQKAEIEALTMENKQLKSDLQLLKGDYEYVKDNLDEIVERDKQLILKLILKLAKAYSEQKTIKSEAIKEFAEKLANEYKTSYYLPNDDDMIMVAKSDMDNLIKEMVNKIANEMG